MAEREQEDMLDEVAGLASYLGVCMDYACYSGEEGQANHSVEEFRDWKKKIADSYGKLEQYCNVAEDYFHSQTPSKGQPSEAEKLLLVGWLHAVKILEGIKKLEKDILFEKRFHKDKTRRWLKNVLREEGIGIDWYYSRGVRHFQGVGNASLGDAEKSFEKLLQKYGISPKSKTRTRRK